jgi:Ca2+/H+ antiporter
VEDPQPQPSAAAERPSVAAVAKPDGPIAAVLIATGIGAFVLGVLTVWAEASVGFRESLAYNDRVGPLSGKTIWATVAFIVSWIVLTLALRRRRVELIRATVVSVVLLGLGYLGTFSPFFRIFESE